MAKPRKARLVQAKYYRWRVYTRYGVFYCDGRSNQPNTGVHSLGTRSREQALRRLGELDVQQAIKHGLAEHAVISQKDRRSLPISEGRRLYEKHQDRPRIAGGIRPVSKKRYRAAFDKFEAFARASKIENCEEVDGPVIQRYLAKLEKRPYAEATIYFEGTVIKQMLGWLAEEGHFQQKSKIKLTLRKPQGTSTYCWAPAEFLAIVEYCRNTAELKWLADIVATLGQTGLRISELVNLRWEDIDLETGMIKLVDESRVISKVGSHSKIRTLKSGRDRAFPINKDLRPVLEGIHRHRDGFVFHGPKGGRVKDDRVRIVLERDVLNQIADPKSGITVSPGFVTGRLHSFRHFFCSVCANSGVPIQTTMRWLGHRDSKMVLHYYHLHDGESQRQMSRVNFGFSSGTLPVESGSVSSPASKEGTEKDVTDRD
jgi:integrase